MEEYGGLYTHTQMTCLLMNTASWCSSILITTEGDLTIHLITSHILSPPFLSSHLSSLYSESSYSAFSHHSTAIHHQDAEASSFATEDQC